MGRTREDRLPRTRRSAVAIPSYCYRCGALCPSTSSAHAHCNGVARVPDLTQRQVEILELGVKYYSPPEIAQALGINKYAVRNHLYTLYRRFGVDSKAALLNAYLEYKAGTRKLDGPAYQLGNPRTQGGVTAPPR